MSCTRRDLHQIEFAIRTLDNNVCNVKLAYALAKNLKRIKRELECIQEATKPSKEYAEFDRRRDAIAAGMAQKNKAGEPVTYNGQYVILNQDALDKALAPLREEFSVTIKEHKQKLSGVDDLLDEEVPFKFYTVPESILEEDGVFTSGAVGVGSPLSVLLDAIIVEKPDVEPTE